MWLYRETQRLKICRPLRDFKRRMCELKERGEKVVRVHVGRGDGRLMRVRKMSRKDDADDAPDGPTDDQERCADDALEKVERADERSEPPANIVLGLSLPQWRHSMWAEPMIMIQHYDPRKLPSRGSVFVVPVPDDLAAMNRRAA